MTRRPKPADESDGRLKEAKGYWSKTVTSGHVSVYAWEHQGRGNKIYVKYASSLAGTQDGRVKNKLPGDFSVRNARGRLDDQRIEAVEVALNAFAARLTLGQDPSADLEPQPAPEAGLTLRAAFRLGLDPLNGKYVQRTLRAQEVARARDKLERILGPHILLREALKPGSVQKVWRTLAREYVRKEGLPGPRCGRRQTEVTVDALYSMAEWVKSQELLSPEESTWKRIKDWRTVMKDEWFKETGEPVETEEEDGPRHTVEEMHALFNALDDPRRRLFRELICTVPEGALASARWSGLAFDPQSGTPMGLTVHWDRRVRTKGVERSSWNSRPVQQYFPLERHQQERVSESLSGYLRGLERARLSAAIEDYPLFPACDLIEGVAPDTTLDALTVEGGGILTFDERFELAFEIGGEQRVGQVIRSTRRALILPEIDGDSSGRVPPEGRLSPPSAGKKIAEPIALSASQGVWVRHALSHGYLREFEAAFRVGRIRDYPLFPAERLVRGIAPFRLGAQPLSPDAARKMFRQLEIIAGVEYVKGRGWYGVRRIAADLVEDVSGDERVQDAVMANSKDTRRKNYQEKDRPRVLAMARDTRQQMRGREAAVPAPVAPDAAPSFAAVVAALQSAGVKLTEEQIKALLHPAAGK